MRPINISEWDAYKADMLRGRNEHEHYDMGYIDALEQIDDWLDAQPAITLDDPRPKGRWEPVDARYSRCTNCKKERNVRTQIAWAFCPSCGADMRGGGEDA